MSSSNLNRQSMIYADGYSYTEIFEVPELPGIPGRNQLIRVFHSLFSDELETALDAELGPTAEALKVPGEVA